MKSLLVIVNPIAGGKDKTGLVQTVGDMLDKTKYSVSVAYTEYAGHAYDLAFSTDAEVVVAIGGDGTLNEVARALSGTGKTFGIVPCGSGNGFARHLGISMDPTEAVKVINEGVTVSVDEGFVNGNPFFCTTGVGFDAVVGYLFSKAGSRGLGTYIKMSLAAWMSFKPEKYRITVDGKEEWHAPAAIVTVGNANQWGNNAKIAPKASVCDGKMDITIVKPFHLWSALGLLVSLFKGTMDQNPHAVCLRGGKITVMREKEGPFHFDGEPSTTGRTIEIDLSHSSLDVFVPKEKVDIV